MAYRNNVYNWDANSAPLSRALTTAFAGNPRILPKIDPSAKPHPAIDPKLQPKDIISGGPWMTDKVKLLLYVGGTGLAVILLILVFRR